MARTGRPLLTALAWLGLLPGLAAAPLRAATFDDGRVHVVDAEKRFEGEDVFLFDSEDGRRTTLVVRDGGLVGGIIVASDRSRVQVEGGRIREVILSDQAHLAMSDGYIDFRLLFLDESTGSISGGRFFYVQAASASRVTIHGGGVDSTLLASDRGVLRLFGASSRRVRSHDRATLEIYGSGFNLGRGDVTRRQGNLRGTLQSQRELRATFQRGEQATLRLLPEPEARWLLPAAILGAALARPRSRACA